MFLVTKNETRRQLGVVHVFSASSQVDGWAGVDSGGPGWGWKVLEAPAQETLFPANEYSFLIKSCQLK